MIPNSLCSLHSDYFCFHQRVDLINMRSNIHDKLAFFISIATFFSFAPTHPRKSLLRLIKNAFQHIKIMRKHLPIIDEVTHPKLRPLSPIRVQRVIYFNNSLIERKAYMHHRDDSPSNYIMEELFLHVDLLQYFRQVSNIDGGIAEP